MHVVRNRLVDAKGQPFLIRGTQLPGFNPQTEARDAASGQQFGPHSATTFSSIRQRWNMNAVRVALNVLDDSGDRLYLAQLGGLVRRANKLQLFVILAAQEPAANPSPQTARFWTHVAAYFKDYPNVMFDAYSASDPANRHSAVNWQSWRRGMEDVVHAIRAAGARQPVAIMAPNDDTLFEGLTPEFFIDDPNIVYEVSPRYRTTRTDGERDRQFGFLADRVPILANDWDLEINRKSPDCAAIPADPSTAEELVQGNLDYFDAHGISWTASVFEPGKLIADYADQSATTLENGWTCGEPASPPPGLGAMVQFHLWGGEMRGLFAVSGAGGFSLPRGSVAIAYGGILAEKDSRSSGSPLPTELGKVSVRITDRLGVSRLADMIWASAGWGQVNFIVPPNAAPGPAHLTLLRADGSTVEANTTIVDVAPGIWTTFANGRGPVIGEVTQTVTGGKSRTYSTFKCAASKCRTVPIPLPPNASTKVRLTATGFRNAGPTPDIKVEIAGIRVPVVAVEPSTEPGVDYLTVELTPKLRGVGEADLICSVNGRLSNVVRINVDPPLSAAW